MEYKDYDKSRNLVWQILIDHRVCTLPVKTVSMCSKLGIAVKLYHGHNGNDGYCKMYGDTPIIFVNKHCSMERQRFTVAHELGHLLLGHVGRYPLVSREPNPKDNPIEQAANVFASRLLAPICVLHEIGIKSSNDISRLCGISCRSADIRWKRLQQIERRNKEFQSQYSRGCFYLNPLEYKVYEQFYDFIKKNQLEVIRGIL